MLQYNANLRPQAPPHQQSVASMAAQKTPYPGQNHADVFNSLQQGQAVNMARYAQQQQDKFQSAAGEAERTAALGGLSFLSQVQRDNNQLQSDRIRMLLNGLL